MFYIKIHKGLHSVVAICDADLIGKSFKQGKLRLSISEHFYKGERKNLDEITHLLVNSSNLNLVGPKIIQLALSLNLITKKQILVIDGVPHAQIISC